MAFGNNSDPRYDPSTLPPPELSFGQKAVGITFNPGWSDEVNKIKQIMAVVIDEMNDLRNSTKSQEVKRLCSVAITELQWSQMWCVKALTWKD